MMMMIHSQGNFLSNVAVNRLDETGPRPTKNVAHFQWESAQVTITQQDCPATLLVSIII